MLKHEIINSIREKLIIITSGKKDKPVFFRKLMITLPEKKKYGWTNYFYLHCIFFGNDNSLYGDLLSISNKNEREFLFGKEIESLERNDLEDLLLALKGKNWSISDDKEVNNNDDIPRDRHGKRIAVH